MRTPFLYPLNVILAILTLLLFSNPLTANIDQALKLIKMGQPLPEKVFTLIDIKTLEEKDQDNPKAQFILATLYSWGHGEIKVDLNKAVTYYEASAKSGFAPAQSGLGDLIRERQILNRPSKEALAWQLKAAEQEDPWSYACLAILYGRSSASVKTSVAEMSKWIELAKKSGNQVAIGRVLFLEGSDYLDGRNRKPRDLKVAEERLKEAVENHSPNAMRLLGFITGGGMIGKPDPIAAGQLYQKAAKLGNIRAVSFLAGLYLNGEGVKKDLKTSAELYEYAAELGDSMAMIQISHQYEKGKNRPKDPAKALYWMKKATTAGTLDAHYALAQYYENGSAGLEKNIEQAIKWYEKAAMSRSAGGGWTSYTPAVDRLASIHMGHGASKRNPAKALRWLQRSKLPRSKYELACLYRDGEEVEQDLSRAFELFKNAASKGHQDAILEVVKALEKGSGVLPDKEKSETWRKKLKP